MPAEAPGLTGNKRRAILLLSILVSIFWIAGMTLDVYRYAAVGAIYEALWLPGILLMCLLSGLNLLYWRRDHFRISSPFLYSFLLLAAVVLYTICFS